jgi:hypothetical protein
MMVLSQALREHGAITTLLAPRAAVQRLAMISGASMPEVLDFKSRTTRADWLALGSGCWTGDLPSLDDYDEVVSDNLVEILSLRPQAWLSGSFFWHMALSGFPSDKAIRAEELLARHHPRMISTGMFAAPYLAVKTRLFTVGMYALIPKVRDGQGTDLLVSCGLGGEADVVTQEFLRRLAAGARPGAHVTVWVEPALFRPDMPSWMRPASFTPSMYGRLLAAVIRPGIGTVTDALLTGARLFMFHESDNLEIADNARRVAAAELGVACVGVAQAWQAAMDYLKSRQAQEHHRAVVRELDSDGANEAACMVLKGG